MAKLALFLCSLVVVAALTSAAGAAEPASGTLSVDGGKGVVTIDLRGSVLGKLGGGALRVTDQTPNDRYAALVAGKRLTQTRLGARTVVYRGSALRFRMLGGGYRVVARGCGITVSAVGHGSVILDGDPKYPGDNVGVYSFDGVDCSVEPDSCVPLPTDPQRFTLEPGGAGSGGAGP